MQSFDEIKAEVMAAPEGYRLDIAMYYLEGAMGRVDETAQISVAFGVSKSVARVMRKLAAYPGMTFQATDLFAATLSGKDPMDEAAIVRVLIHKAKRAMERAGIPPRIANVYGLGYFMPKDVAAMVMRKAQETDAI
jgi:DNA-binding response OmpR family regulator